MKINDVTVHFKANSKLFTRPNCMNRMHDNEVNNIAEINLINEILNPSERIKI